MLIEWDRHAVLASVEVVSRVTPADLGRDTPCAGWSLGDLLAHMAAQHHGFAAAANGGGADLSVWAVRPLGEDPVAEYRDAAQRVIEAFGRDGVLGRQFVLPEISLSFRSFRADLDWMSTGVAAWRPGSGHGMTEASTCV